MRRAIAVESLKLRRSMVATVTAVFVVVFTPLLCIGFLAIAHSGGAGSAALKAQAMVTGEGWDGYLGVLGQVTAVAMFIGPGIVVTWSFGREHSDRTFPSLFALPVSRRSIATSKFLVLTVWGLALTVLLLAAATVAGLVAQVGPLGSIDLLPRLVRLGVAGFLTCLLALTVGYVASIGRGYLPAFAALILLTMITQIAVLLGTGGWFPYAAPGLYALAGTDGIPEISPLQLAAVPVTVAIVAWLTVQWWQHAEVS